MSGRLIFNIIDNIKFVKFSYDPLLHIENQLTACLDDRNLEIEAKALKSCFSENTGNSIKLISDEKEIPLTLGSNNITGENIKDKRNLKFKINIDGKAETIERNETESCAKLVKGSQRTEESKIQTPVIGIAIGTVVPSVGGAAIVFAVLRRRRMKKKNLEVGGVGGGVDDNPTYGEEDYEGGEEAVVTDQNPTYDS